MKPFTVALVLLLLFLQYRLWFGQGGIAQVQTLRQKRDSLEVEIEGLSQRNGKLAAEVIDLKQGLEAVEERARTEMGMIREGEIFYRIVELPEAPPAEKRHE